MEKKNETENEYVKIIKYMEKKEACIFKLYRLYTFISLLDPILSAYLLLLLLLFKSDCKGSDVMVWDECRVNVICLNSN
jgi:hypothetical protein